MAVYHTVKQGEHLSGIAAQYGFRHYATLWEHPENKALKELRGNPNVLFPGDRVFIPDKESKRMARQSGARHRFRVKEQTLTLRLVIEDIYEKPVGNADYELIVGAETLALATDGEGRLEHEVPVRIKDVELLIKDSATPLKNVSLLLRIGELDPVTEVSGQIARLRNLGYYTGSVKEVDQRLFLMAVEEFQCDQKLTVDGVCGHATQAKLKAVHGC